jgi:putative ABC transport system permease protein
MEIRPIFSALLRNKTAPLLVALQVAISLALLVNALHVVNLRLSDANRPSGIEDESTVFHIDARTILNQDPAHRLALKNASLQALSALPGVRSVALSNQMPMSRNGQTTGLAASRTQTEPNLGATFYTSSGGLVKTLGLKLVEGRDFLAHEVLEPNNQEPDTRQMFGILSLATAQALFPGAKSVLGKEYYIGTGADATGVRIVGVVEHLQSVHAQPGPDARHSSIQAFNSGQGAAFYVIRTAPGELDKVMQAAETTLRKIANEPLVIKKSSVQNDRTKRYQNETTLASTLLTVSALLLLITASGVVGMSSLWVAQRKKQIGIRRALGARQIDIVRYFISENILITSFGVSLGLGFALALNHLLVRQLEMSRLPLAFLLAASVLFLLLGVMAALGPALRAARILPALATRSV